MANENEELPETISAVYCEVWSEKATILGALAINELERMFDLPDYAAGQASSN